MGGSFLRGVVVGLVCALLGGAAVALAGSGVGGVFNLGVSNPVSGQTELGGSTNAPQLRVDNTNTGSSAFGLAVNAASPAAAALGVANASSGPGVFARSAGVSNPTLKAQNTGGGPAGGFLVNSGVTPFTVNSAAKVNNLNADRLDGFDVSQIMTGGGRIGRASFQNLYPPGSPDVQATVSLTAPNNGFVLVQGAITAEDLFSAACNVCQAVVRIHDVSANVDSIPSTTTFGNGVPENLLTIPIEWVFPITAGAHSYTLNTGQSDTSGGPALFDNPVLTAEFIPFGHSGSSTILSADGENTIATPTETDTGGISRGKP
jgi:hypothetical protein